MWDSGSNFIMNMGSSADLPTNSGVFSVNASTRNFMIGTSVDAGYKLRVAGNVLTYGGIYNQGDHYSSWIQNTLPAANNGAGQGDVQLRMWCSEPGVTWSWAGFGYNVNNDGAGAYGFSRTNTSFGQAYMRFSTDGSLYFYNANTSGTRVQTAAFGYDGFVTFSGAGSFAGNLTMTQDSNDLIFQQTNSSTHGIVWKNTSYSKESASIKPTNLGAWATQGIGFYTGAAGDSTTAPTLRLDIQPAGTVAVQNNVGNGVVGTNFIAYALDADSYFRLGNNTSNSLDIQLTRSDSATMFSVNGHSGTTYFAGQVGVGTSSPGNALSSAGGIVINSGASNDAQLRLQNNTSGSGGSDGGILSISGTTMYVWNYEASPLIFGTNNSERMRLSANGNLLVATTTDSGYKVDIVGDTRITSGALGVNVAPSATDGRIDASNDIVAYSTSDRRLKENITPIANALDKVKALTGVEFDWKEETKHVHGYEGHDTGVIAQEVKDVMPTAIRQNDSGYLSVRYEKLIGLLIEAVKEQQGEIEELKKIIGSSTKNDK
jgi:hypothetical protein